MLAVRLRAGAQPASLVGSVRQEARYLIRIIAGDRLAEVLTGACEVATGDPVSQLI